MLALMTWGSLTPNPPQGPEIPHLDKAEHALAYLFLSHYFLQLSRMFPVLLGLAGYGLLIELAQDMGGHRFFELADLAANLTGITVGLLWMRTGKGGSLAKIESWGARWTR